MTNSYALNTITKGGYNEITSYLVGIEKDKSIHITNRKMKYNAIGKYLYRSGKDGVILTFDQVNEENPWF